MDYLKISKEGIVLLFQVIENNEKGITTSPRIVEELLNKFTILSEATEKVLLQNQRENETALELLRRTSLFIINLKVEQDNLKSLIDNNRRSITANDTTKKKAQQDLIEIKARIAEAEREIDRLKPKIEFQWWWVFCWWCGLIAAGIQNEINAKHAEIEKLQLNCDLIESSILNNNIDEFNKTIQRLENKLKQDQEELEKLNKHQNELEVKAKLFAGKTASSSQLNSEINLIKTNLQKLYDRRDMIDLLKVRLDAVLNFCDGQSYKQMPMSKILSGWGETLNDELNPTGASVQAVRLAIDGIEFGHLRKVTEFEWEFVPTTKFEAFKDEPVAKILNLGKFKETHRDKWSIYLQDGNQYISIDIWKKLLTTTSKKNGEKYTVEIIDGALAEKVHFYKEDHISQDAVASLCEKNNWRLASEFEVSIAWIHHKLNIFAFGQLQNNLVAVPIQEDTGERFKRGLNIMPFNSKGSGNQGFFYVDNKIMTFRKLRPAKA